MKRAFSPGPDRKQHQPASPPNPRTASSQRRRTLGSGPSTKPISVSWIGAMPAPGSGAGVRRRGHRRRGQVLRFVPEVFVPLSSGLMNPIGRLGGSGGVMSSRRASKTSLS